MVACFSRTGQDFIRLQSERIIKESSVLIVMECSCFWHSECSGDLILGTIKDCWQTSVAKVPNLAVLA